MAEVAGSSSEDGSEEFEGGRDLDRVVFFSDAVFAIAMTVLALTLSLPAGTTDAGVAHALDKAIPSILAYVLSFAVIAIYWLAHHRMFRYIRRLDATLLVLNLATLGAVAFVPFPTSVLGEHGSTTAAVVFYAATMAVLGGLVSTFWIYATHRRRFIRADTPPRFVKHALWRAITFPAVFVASIPIAFADPHAAEWFWLTIVAVRFCFAANTAPSTTPEDARARLPALRSRRQRVRRDRTSPAHHGRSGAVATCRPRGGIRRLSNVLERRGPMFGAC